MPWLHLFAARPATAHQCNSAKVQMCKNFSLNHPNTDECDDGGGDGNDDGNQTFGLQG